MTALYGATVLEHFRRPRNQRRLEEPTASGEAFNPLCGDRVRIDLAIARNTIRVAVFTANACAICTASASLLTERVTGVTVDDAAEVREEQVVAALETSIPDARLACATLPLRALHDALSQLPSSPE